MKQQSNIIVKSSNNGISRIKLNEPSTYNSLSLNTLESLIESFKNFNDDEKTKVIIIEGSGKGFSAGHNLKEINSLKFILSFIAPSFSKPLQSTIKTKFSKLVSVAVIAASQIDPS